MIDDDPIVGFGMFAGCPVSRMIVENPPYSRRLRDIPWLARDHPEIHARLLAAFPPAPTGTPPMDDIDRRSRALAAATRAVLPGTAPAEIYDLARDFDNSLLHGWPATDAPEPDRRLRPPPVDTVPDIPEIQATLREIEANCRAAGSDLAELQVAHRINPATWHCWKQGAYRPRSTNWVRVCEMLEESRGKALAAKPGPHPGAPLNGVGTRP